MPPIFSATAPRTDTISRMSLADFAACLVSHPDGVMIAVWAVAGASRTEVSGLHGDAVRVRVTARPEGGRANQTIIELLAELFGAPVDLMAGATSRRKRFLVRGASVAEVAEALIRATGS